MSPFALCIALWETRFYQDHARKIQNIRWSGSFGYPSSLRSKIQWNLNKVQNRNNESCFTKISYQQGLIELDWETHSEREDRGTGEDEEAVCVCVCETSRSASLDLPPLFKCWKRQFACSPPAFSACRSVWSNLPFQTHFYLIASSETKWHRGRTLG